MVETPAMEVDDDRKRFMLCFRTIQVQFAQLVRNAIWEIRQYMHSVRLMLFGESVCVAGMTGVGVDSNNAFTGSLSICHHLGCV